MAVEERVDAQRVQLHRMWGSVAGGWATHAEWVDARGAGVTAALLELSAPRPGERVLELAGAAGAVGIAAAELVGESGEVVVSDVTPAMTAIADERIAALGLRHVSTRVLDLEAIDEPDESYDVVVCREGLMLVPDPMLAAREILRVLRPGGRVAVSVWGARARNPWLAVVFDSVGAELGAPVPPPGVPGPFSLDDAALLSDVLVGAGFADVAVGELSTPYCARSTGEWWARTCELAGPLAQRLATLPEPVADALRDRASEAIGAYATPAGLEIPGVSLLAGARRG